MKENRTLFIVLALVAGAIVVVVLTRKPATPTVIVQQTPAPNGGQSGPWDVVKEALPFLFG